MLGPRTKPFTFVKKDTQCSNVRTVRWQENESMASILWVSKIDDDIKHIFREHNREADNWANFGSRETKELLLTAAAIQRHGKR